MIDWDSKGILGEQITDGTSIELVAEAGGRIRRGKTIFACFFFLREKFELIRARKNYA